MVKRVSEKTTVPLVWVFVLIGICGSMIMVAATAALSMGRLYQRVDDHEKSLVAVQEQIATLTRTIENSNSELAEIKSIMRGIRSDGKNRLRLAPDEVSWCEGGWCHRPSPEQTKGIRRFLPVSTGRPGFTFSF